MLSFDLASNLRADNMLTEASRRRRLQAMRAHEEAMQRELQQIEIVSNNELMRMVRAVKAPEAKVQEYTRVVRLED